MIEDKYGVMEGGWGGGEGDHNVACVWRNITKGWVNFYKNFSFKVGDGRRISFWGHIWCGNMALKDDFLSIYRISCQREAVVHQIRGTQGEEAFGI